MHPHWHRNTYRRAWSLGRRAVWQSANLAASHADLGGGYCLTTAIERETVIGPGSMPCTEAITVSVHPTPGVLALVRPGVVLDVAIDRPDLPRLIGAAVRTLAEHYRTMPRRRCDWTIIDEED